MIQIESIRIENFRGIKHLIHRFDRKNLGIAGPNGTGKSGIVDAIEFALTGEVTRLSGTGTGSVSVKQHAAHVDIRDQPRKAVVALTATTATGTTFTIERSVANPRKPTLTPTNDETTRLALQLSAHPEFALSRREILKYVIAEPGSRAKEVQALLKLDAVEKVRASLTTITNTAKERLKSAEQAVATAREQLLSAMKIEELRPALIVEAANQRRSILGLDGISELQKDTSLKAGIGTGPATKSPVSRANALEEIEKLENTITTPPAAATKSAETVLQQIDSLQANPSLRRTLAQRAFLTAGVDLIDDVCPFCETTWDPEALRRDVRARIAQAQEADATRTEIVKAAEPLLTHTNNAIAAIHEVERIARRAAPDVDLAPLTTWATALTAQADRLRKCDDLDAISTRLRANWQGIPTSANEALTQLRATFNALPEAPAEEQAKEYLILAQERLEAFQKTRRQQDLAKQQHQLATTVAETYGRTTTAFLTRIYEQVQEDFSRFYATINPADEAEFTAKLTPSVGKLGFEVDFYGRGYFPPGAYHSEGHQDGMGLCLYLALMRRTMGTDFTFAVLDDVLMSVDAGHRKDVCRLLKTEFPSTQFIFTTHDDAWLQHMKNEGLVGSSAVLQFRKWSVEDGPHVWQFEDVWAEIQDDLDHANVPGAAATLRRYLEHLGGELSQRIRAHVEYRSSGVGYELAELWNAVIARWNDLLGQAKASAQSWKKHEDFEQLKLRHEDFKNNVARTKADQWELNAAVHYNAWAALQKADFQPLVDAFKDLIACFTCTECDALLYVAPPRGNVETIRCDCNQTSINLKKQH